MSKRRQVKDGFGNAIVQDLIDQGFTPLFGMEGPFQYQGGRVLYYDRATGEHYDRGLDMYLTADEACRVTG